MLGPGSEVLGFGTARSTARDRGPRPQLLLYPVGLAEHCVEVSGRLLAGTEPPALRPATAL
ncbi:hypothetical protein [Crossiella cryophila]|uniref:Uncharacterized protein n=1 Tax=Crossiella cryophila TaxID=43355 RepID=A0A7W7FUQ7_9PSEU|nr:hypothetical protein [Crossiella cryophila]MBB4678487.1 hypothetical protein [Crossiella cryophila]